MGGLPGPVVFVRLTLDKEPALSGHWHVRHERAAAGSLHATAAAALNDGPPVRSVRFPIAERPALVLGSHQPAETFDRDALDAAGVELARRRSGGSAVLVGPGRVLWVDFVIPAGDPLWDDDVGRAAWWVGDLWAGLIDGAQVWKGRMRTNAWSPVVCFAGLGPGEVTVGDRKVVGVCQRRTGRAALFQTAAVLDWRPDDYTALMARLPGPVPDLADAATGLGAEAEAGLKSALLSRLVP